MIEIMTTFGEDAVWEYGENNELSPEEWLADNEGIVNEKESETEVKCNAYVAGVNDVDGWSDYRIMRHRSEEADTSRERNPWLRFGINVWGNRESTERILDGNTKTLRKLLNAGCYEIDGEIYIPGLTVEGCNEDHDTEFEEEDVESHL